MNILFVSKHLQYNVATPESEPLGGSESCLSYLARALAARGHNVTVMLNLPPGTPDTLMGVRHVPLAYAASKAFFEASHFDAIVTSNAPDAASRFKPFSPGALHISWVHLLAQQIQTGRPSQAAPVDCTVYLSQSQKSAFPPDQRSFIIGNGIAPPFQNMFASAEALLAAKQNRAAYTSTPFRGLGMLIAVTETAITDTEVDIYSSMRVYQSGDEAFQVMIDHIRRTPRMQYHGSLPQRVLAERLKQTAFLFYPCIYTETFCISAIEAIASGMEVITTDFGALKEATRGFAAMIPFDPSSGTPDMLRDSFRALTQERVAAFKADPQGWAEARFAQLQEINRDCTWDARAAEWETVLSTLNAEKAA